MIPSDGAGFPLPLPFDYTQGKLTPLPPSPRLRRAGRARERQSIPGPLQ